MLQNINDQAKINYIMTFVLVSIVLLVTFCESDYYKNSSKDQYVFRKNNTAQVSIETKKHPTDSTKELLIINKKYYSKDKLIGQNQTIDTLPSRLKQFVKNVDSLSDYEIYVDVKNSMVK